MITIWHSTKRRMFRMAFPICLLDGYTLPGNMVYLHQEQSPHHPERDIQPIQRLFVLLKMGLLTDVWVR